MGSPKLSGNLSDRGEVPLWYHKIYLAAFSLIIVALLFNIRFSFYAIGLTLFVWILQARRHVKNFDRGLLFPFLVFISLYVVQLIGLIHSDNFSTGLNKLESKLSLLIFPVLVLISWFGEKEIRFMKWVFVIATTAACLWCHVVLVKVGVIDHVSWKDLFTQYNYRTTYFAAPLKIHPTYLTIFAAFSFFLLMQLLQNRRPLFKNIVLIFALAYASLVAYQAVSRAGIAIFLLTLVGVFLYDALSGKRNKWLGLACVIAVAAVVTGVFSNELMRQRFLNEFKSLSESNFVENESSMGQHVKSWRCSMELIWSDHFLFGYGTGDEKDMLGTCYSGHHWELMSIQKNDAHNEFLSSGVRHGIVGIGLLIFFFGFTFKRAWQTRDIIYLVFLAMFFLTSFVESTLKARTGVVFFSMFNVLLFKANYLKSKIEDVVA